MSSATWLYRAFEVSQIVVILLYCLFRHISCLEGYWIESTSLRNYQPDSKLVSTTASSHYACMMQCLMTDGCCFISYVTVNSTCVRHLGMGNVQSQESSSVWYIINDDNCPCGWHRFEASCFLFTNIYMTWNDSVAYCRILDARLAEADSKKKDSFIRGIAATTSGSFWLGGSDSDQENTWLWTASNLSMTKYDNWAPTNPNNYGGQGENADCICIGSWLKFYWDDCNCWEEQAPVCEKPVI
ncbi:perlucin-like [Pecten maximus]|uniref:perlucin-like n=1 Tax=Pecten maximus TaxID=6579 RepID=UPI001458E035|nr:perlucin-like [Pecten maximus]